MSADTTAWREAVERLSITGRGFASEWLVAKLAEHVDQHTWDKAVGAVMEAAAPLWEDR